MTAAFQGFRSVVAAAFAAALVALGGCGGEGAGAAGTPGDATQAPPPAPSVTGPGTGQVAVTVSSAVPASGDGALSGNAVTGSSVTGTTRAVVADATSATGLAHRIRVEYDSVSGLVLAVAHTWGETANALDLGGGACARVVTASIPTLCTGATVDPAAGRITFSNTLLRGGGSFRSLLNGTVTFQAP